MFVVDGLPATIRVGGHDISVKIEDRNWSDTYARYGQFSSSEMRISLTRERASASVAVETVIHETLHVVYWLYDIADDDKEERVVERFAAGLQQVWRDNPDLIGWIDKAVKDG